MWHQVIDYFQDLEKHPVQRMAFLVGGLLLFWIIEGSIPLLSLQYKKTKLRHATVNFGFTVIHLLIHTFLAVLIVLLSDWCRQQQFGLVYWANAGIAGTIIIKGGFTETCIYSTRRVRTKCQGAHRRIIRSGGIQIKRV